MPVTITEITILIFLCLYLRWVRPDTELAAGTLSEDITTMTEEKSPYVVRGDVIVPNNSVLVIQPGVTVKFAPGVGVVVKGSLVARGEPEKRIRLVPLHADASSPSAADPVDDKIGNNRGLQMRLTGGGADNKGRLELRRGGDQNGHWLPVCDLRMRDADHPERRRYWADFTAESVCGYLGYKSGNLTREFGPGPEPDPSQSNVTGLVNGRLTGLRCGLNFDVLANRWCRVENHTSCDKHDDIGVICKESVKNFWAGVHQDRRPGQEGEFVLAYVDIEKAGRHGYHPMTSITVLQSKALVNHVTIRDTVQTALTIGILSSSFALQGIDISNVGENAIDIRTLSDNVTLSDISVNGAADSAIKLRAEARHTAPVVDICSRRRIVVDSPMYLRFSRQHSYRCNVVLEVAGNRRLKILHFERSLGSRYGSISVKDGVNSSSPQLLSIAGYTPKVSKISSTSSVLITSYRPAVNRIYISPVLQEGPDMRISSLKITNARIGLSLQHVTAHVLVENSSFQHNGDGVRINGNGGQVFIKTSTIVNNSVSGINSSSFDGYLLLESCTLSHNLVGVSSHSHSFSGCSDFLYAIRVFGSTISNNRFGVRAVSACSRLTLDVISSTVLSNENGISLQSEQELMASVNNTIFSKHSENVLWFRCQGHTTLSLFENTFSENEGQCLSLTSLSIPDDGAITLSDNSFKGNRVTTRLVKFVSLDSDQCDEDYYDDYDYDEEDEEEEEKPAKVKVIGNKFFDNTPTVSTSETLSQVLFTSLVESVLISDNVFNNPEMSYQLVIGGPKCSDAINASYNFWGDGDIPAVFASNKRNSLTEVMVTPYYKDAAKTLVSYDSPTSSQSESDIGGDVTSALMLEISHSPYHVINDLTVTSSGSLIIQAGVEVLFNPGLILKVEGHLQAKGTDTNRIKFGIWEDKSEVNERSVRVKQGVVEIKHNGQWGPVCLPADQWFSSLRSTSEFLCRELGLEYHSSPGSETVSSNASYPGLLQGLWCDMSTNVTVADCYTSPCVGTSCQSCQLMTSSCKKPLWSGIHFSAHAPPGVLQQVNVMNCCTEKRGVGHAALSIALHKHAIQDVSVLLHGTGSAILVHNAVLGSQLKRIDIKLASTRSIGMDLRDPKVSIKKCKISELSDTERMTKGLTFERRITKVDITKSHVRDICNVGKLHLLQESFISFDGSSAGGNLNSTCSILMTTDSNKKIIINVLSAQYMRSVDRCEGVIQVSRGNAREDLYGYLKRKEVVTSQVNEMELVYNRSGGREGCFRDLIIHVQPIQDDENVEDVFMVSGLTIRTDVCLEIREGGNLSFIGLDCVPRYGNNIIEGDNIRMERTTFQGIGELQIAGNSVHLDEFAVTDKKRIITVLASAIFLRHVTLQNSSSDGMLLQPKNDHEGLVRFDIHNSSFMNIQGTALRFTRHSTGRFPRPGEHVNYTILSTVSHSRFVSATLGLHSTSEYVSLVSVEMCEFIDLRNGVYFRGSADISDCIFKNCYSPVFLWGFSRPVTISKSLFMNGTRAIILTPNDQVTQLISITENKFDSYAEAIHFSLSFTNSAFMNVSKNVFTGLRLTALTYRGYGMVTGNIFRDNYVDEGMCGGLLCLDMTYNETLIHDNVFENNKVPFHAIKIDLQTESEDAVLTISDNIFTRNKAVNSSTNFYAVSLSGKILRNIKVIENKFTDFSRYEIRIDIITLYRFYTVNLTLNYWNTTRSKLVFGKVHSEGIASALVPVTVQPFYLDSDMTRLSSSSGEITDTYPVNKHGEIVQFIYSSVYLRSADGPYIVINGVTIGRTASLEIEAGTTVYFAHSAGMSVFGRLIVNGSPEQKVIFARLLGDNVTSAQVNAATKPSVRLHNVTVDTDGTQSGILQINWNNRWYFACGASTNIGNLAHIACRELGMITASSYQVVNEVFVAVEPSGHVDEPLPESQQVGYLLMTCTNAGDNVRSSCYMRPYPRCLRIIETESGNHLTHDILKIRCLNVADFWGSLQFKSRVHQSSLRHLELRHGGYFNGSYISGIQVKGRMPLFDDVILRDCAGDGVVLQDIESRAVLSGLKFKNVYGDAIQFVTRTPIVHINKVQMSNVYGKGVFLSDNYHRHKVVEQTLISDKLNGFILCDAVRILHVSRGDVISFSDTLATARKQCVMTFVTDENSVLEFTLNWAYSAKCRQKAAFHDGSSTDHPIIYPKYEGYFNGLQRYVAISLTNKMTVSVPCSEDQIKSGTMVKASERRFSKCTFREGYSCGFSNTSETVNGTTPTVHWNDPMRARLAYNLYRTMSQDASGQNGFYLVAGVSKEELKDFDLTKDHIAVVNKHEPFATGACGVSFSVSSTDFTRTRLEVYIQRTERKLMIGQIQNRGRSWSRERLIFPSLPEMRGNYSLNILFVAVFNLTNINGAIGIAVDDITLQRCENEGNINIKSLQAKSMVGSSVYIAHRYRDRDKIESITVANSEFDMCSSPYQTDQYAVHMDINAPQIFIHNSYFTCNKRSLSITSRTVRQAEVNIAQNYFQYGRPGTVNIQLYPSASSALVTMHNNVIHGSKSTQYDHSRWLIIVRVNAPGRIELEGNLMYNNTMHFLWQIYGEKLQKGSIRDNIIAYNRVASTLLISAPNISASDNVLVNYPLSPRGRQPPEVTFNNVAYLNTTSWTPNWFGRGSDLFRAFKTNSYRVVVPKYVYTPELSRPPDSFALIHSRCSLGWTKAGRICIQYIGGARDYITAQQTCALQGGQLLGENDLPPSDALKDFLHMKGSVRFGNGSLYTPAIWLPATLSGCRVLNVGKNGGDSKTDEDCQALHPYICRVAKYSRCPNACSLHGRCLENKCVCDSGYQGYSCAEFACDGVNECSGSGTCIGPNRCRCFNGWRGRECTISICTPYGRSCKVCVSRRGCGWCDTNPDHLKCLPGNYANPAGRLCSAWFYRSCVTPPGGECSNEIEVYSECKEEVHCKTESKTYNRRACQKCKDLKSCYTTKKLDRPCQTWNGTRCPNGVILPDYSDTSRVLATTFRDNVKLIPANESTIYLCPVDFQMNDAHMMYVVRDGPDVKEGEIIVSAQAQGIMHRVDQVISIGPFRFVVARPAKLEEVISYADFRQKFDLVEIESRRTVEVTADASLLKELSTAPRLANETAFHNMDEGDIHVWKCIGDEYVDVSGTRMTSSFLVLNNTRAGNIKIGDIVFGSKSGGFLERISGFENTEAGYVVTTRLAECSSDIIEDVTVYVDAIDVSMSCFGGDNFPGLLFLESDLSGEQSFITKDSIVPGRLSGSFAGQVINVKKNLEFTFLEVLDIDDVEDRPLSRVRDKENARTKRDTLFEKSYEAKYAKEFSREFSQILTLSAKLEASFTPKVSLDCVFQPDPPFVERLGVSLDGPIDLVLEMKASYSDSITISGPPANSKLAHPIDNKKIASFAVPVWATPPIALPGAIFFDVTFSYDVNIKAGGYSGELKAGVTGKGKATGGATWRASTGAVQVDKPNVNIDVDSEFAAESDSEGEKSEMDLSATLSPAVILKWPSVPQLRLSVLRKIPKWLRKSLKLLNEADRLVSLTATMTTPLFIKAYGKACSEMCITEKDRPLNVGGSGGIEAIKIDLNLDVYKYHENFPLLEFSSPSLVVSNDKCVAQPVPCCICQETGEPSELDPETGDCMCKCYCDPPDNTQESYKPKDGECLCEKCPDGKTFKKKKADGTLWCPCRCLDNTISEQLPDGTCNCTCTCEDQSTDAKDVNGKCPCKCTCKNCEDSTKGPDGCKCPDDICDKRCKGGESPEWIACECRCPDDIKCGIPPVCRAGRRGPKCDVPDCSPCQGCSGRGYCVSLGECGARCSCRYASRGICCRPSQRAYGDPHFRSLDGKYFDYHGIGEFWMCKSKQFDMGIQQRYYAYRWISFLGGVAVKAGQSTITVMACGPGDRGRGDKFSLRINGELISSSRRSRIRLENDTVLVTRTSGSTLTIHFKNGVHIRVIGHSYYQRCYLESSLNLPGAMMGTTEGLCGNYDNNQANDLIGPDGNLYRSSHSFGESWRIISSSGGPWSWDASNFHEDDIMDDAYTTANHNPRRHKRDGQMHDKAVEICKAMDIQAPELMAACVLDVEITEDPDVAQQETFTAGKCPNDCSDNGVCRNGTCQCMDGWSGTDCSVGPCDQCSQQHGICVSGFCQCETGWEGPHCDRKATCFNVNNCTSPDHGACKVTDQCLCRPGFTGADCSEVARCYSRSNCSQHGDCVDHEVCKCHPGWTGDDCTGFSCEEQAFCSDRGRCIGFGICACVEGWTGSSCAMPDCKSVNHCSGNGICDGPNQCRCIPGYQGIDCSELVPCEHLNNCSNHGLCISVQDRLECSCDGGFLGAMCEKVECSLVAGCMGHGDCYEPNVCSCHTGYTGRLCSDYDCADLDFCSGHGNCTGINECTCHDNWFGDDCSVTTCNAVNNCSSQGQCVGHDVCECYSGFEGRMCEKAVPRNLQQPRFVLSATHVTIRENAPVGTTVATVKAEDNDQGVNGEVRYSLSSRYPVQMFSIHPLTGQITTAVVIDREVLQENPVVLTARATDSGMPPMSDVTEIYIHVLDVNDNCPSFISYPKEPINLYMSNPKGHQITIIKAEDPDLGENGRIVYSLRDRSYSTAPPVVEINNMTGQVYLSVDSPQSGDYLFAVVARDSGLTPCAKTVPLNVRITGVDYENTTPIVTTEQTSTIYEQNVTTQTMSTEETTDESSTVVVYPSPKPGDNLPLIIGLSVTFSVLFLISVAIIAVVVYRKKHAYDSVKTKEKADTHEMEPL